MKVRTPLEIEVQTAYDLAMWLSNVAFKELPPSIGAVRREELFKAARHLGSRILNAEVGPSEIRSTRARKNNDPERICRLVDWISGIK